MRKKQSASTAAVTQLRNGQGQPFGALRSYVPLGAGDTQLYQSMREAVPILDAAIGKLVRLTGGFRAECAQGQQALNEFLRTVPVGCGQRGMAGFL